MHKNGAWLAGIGALLVCGVVQAQSEPQAATAGSTSSAPQSGEIQEIVVTARKRVETVQSVPATVTVVDQTELAAVGISNFNDISKVLPAINIAPSPDSNQYAATVRGLGTEPGNPSFDASVATYVDGAFLSRDREFGASLFDMSSLETISGAQAALLGKNSSLGAINLVTNKPGDVYAVDVRYQHEFELHSDRVEVGFDVPVSSALKFRVAGLYDGEGGPVRDVLSGEKYHDQKVGGRITAAWTPSETIDVTALVQATNDVTKGPTAVTTLYGDAPNLLATYFGYPNLITTPFNQNAQYSPTLGFDQLYTLNSQLAVVTADFHLGPGTLTSQSSYTRSLASYAGNYSFLPGDALLSTEPPDNSKQFTQELRYSSSVGSRFDYVGGLFYLNSKYSTVTSESTDFPFGSTPLPFPITGAAATSFEQTDNALSAFGQTNYRFIDSLELVLGLRYTDERKEADFARSVVVPGIYSLVLSPPVAPFSLSDSKGSFDGSVGLNYRPAKDIMFYVSWGQGTKAGGYAATVSDLENSFYQPEVAQTAELGFKTQFFDRSLTINGDVFDTYVKKFQVVIFDGINFDVANQNVRSTGFESQVNWLPIHGFRIYWNNIYADARDADSGVSVPYAPRWSGRVGATYEHPVFAGLKGDLDVNSDYRSEEISQAVVAGYPLPTVPPLAELHRLNVGVGLSDPVRGWEVRLIGQNLTNEHTYGFNFGIPFVSSPPGTQNAASYPLAPRTIMLQVSFKR